MTNGDDYLVAFKCYNKSELLYDLVFFKQNDRFALIGSSILKSYANYIELPDVDFLNSLTDRLKYLRRIYGPHISCVHILKKNEKTIAENVELVEDVDKYMANILNSSLCT